MMEALERNLILVAEWGPAAVGVLILLALMGVWRLGRGRRFLVPPGWGGRALSAVLLLWVLALGFVMLLMLGPMSTILADIRRVHAAIGKPAGDIAFSRVSDGTPHRLQDLRGQVVLLNVWATWCPPCRKEMPDLNRLQEAYRDRGVVVVTVSDEPRDTLLAYTKEQPLSTMNVYAESLGWLSVVGRPLSFVIDRDGTLREMFVGARDYETFEEAVRPYLG